MAVTLGLITLAEKTILPLINTGIQKVMQAFGVSEETAKDVMANEILQFAEQVGIGALTLRAKIPTKIAELLGFTSKGWSIRKVSSTQTAKLPTTTSSQTIANLPPQQIANELSAIAQAQVPQYASSTGAFFNNTIKVLGLGAL